MKLESMFAVSGHRVLENHAQKMQHNPKMWQPSQRVDRFQPVSAIRFMGNTKHAQANLSFSPETVALIQAIAAAKPEDLDTLNPVVKEVVHYAATFGQQNYVQPNYSTEPKTYLPFDSARFRRDFVKTTKLLLGIANGVAETQTVSLPHLLETYFYSRNDLVLSYLTQEKQRRGLAPFPKAMDKQNIWQYRKAMKDPFDKATYEGSFGWATQKPAYYHPAYNTSFALNTLLTVALLSEIKTQKPEEQNAVFEYLSEPSHKLHGQSDEFGTVFLPFLFKQLDPAYKTQYIRENLKTLIRPALEDVHGLVETVHATLPEITDPGLKWQVIQAFHTVNHYAEATKFSSAPWQSGDEPFLERSPLFDKFKRDIDTHLANLLDDTRTRLANYATDSAFIEFAKLAERHKGFRDYESGADLGWGGTGDALNRIQQHYLAQITDPMMQRIFRHEVLKDQNASQEILTQYEDPALALLEKETRDYLLKLPSMPNHAPLQAAISDLAQKAVTEAITQKQAAIVTDRIAQYRKQMDDLVVKPTAT